jgi:glycosyltransferase involved in cell wall biosynthesis
MHPLVSVITTSYNREDYIAETIESVLSSTYTNLELIIADDCSKDKTVEIARSYEMKDKRVKVYVNEKNLGDYPNRNNAARYAKGEFLMFVDSDDNILKDGIEKCVNTMMSFQNSDFGMYSFNKEEEPYELTSNEALRKHFFEKPFLMIGPGGTIIRRSFFERIKGYPEKYGPANDLYFNLKACSYSKIIMLPFEILFYRLHEGQEQKNYFSYLHNNYSYFKDALNELCFPISKSEFKWLHKKNKRRFLVNICKFYFKDYNLSKTTQALRKTGFGFKDALAAVFH